MANQKALGWEDSTESQKELGSEPSTRMVLDFASMETPTEHY